MDCTSSTTTSAVQVYDTTLRDGTQRAGVSLSVDDKLAIVRELDRIGVAYVEVGWPGSNAKDAEVFRRLAQMRFRHARPVAFGSTRRAGARVDTDPNVRALIEAGTRTVTIVGEASSFHVEQVLGTTRQENLSMIHDTVGACARAGREVIFDAEHWFDGVRLDREYALAVLQCAAEAGASSVVLCDTNGGSLPDQISADVGLASAALPGVRLGIHAHNDCGLAISNTLAAVQAGCTHVQGTVNGYRERSGSANWLTVAITLQLKLGFSCLPQHSMTRLRDLAYVVADIVGVPPDAPDHVAPFAEGEQ